MTSPSWMQTPLLITIVIEGLEISGTKAGSTAVTDGERRLTTAPPTEETSHHSVNIVVVVLSVSCALAVTGLIAVLLLYFIRGRTRTLIVTPEVPEEEKYYEITNWYEYISFRRFSRKGSHYARRIEKTQGGSVSSRPFNGNTVQAADDQLYETYR